MNNLKQYKVYTHIFFVLLGACCIEFEHFGFGSKMCQTHT